MNSEIEQMTKALRSQDEVGNTPFSGELSDSKSYDGPAEVLGDYDRDIATDRESYEVGSDEAMQPVTGEGSSTSLRDVKIVPLNSGYLVKVGCQSVAVETTETLLARLGDYLNDPYAFEKKWFSKDKRNRLENI